MFQELLSKLSMKVFQSSIMQKNIFSIKEGIMWPYSTFHPDSKRYFDFNNMSDEHKKFLRN